MLCQNCGKNEANVKYTQIVNGIKKEMNLCEECADKMGVGNFNMKMPLSLSDFLGDFFTEYDDLALPAFVKKSTKEKCDNCGLTYDEFMKTGLLGCPECYDTFESRLEPVIKNIQGNIKHVGRGPEIYSRKNVVEKENAGEGTNKKSEKEILEEELKKAIKEERYEDAAKLRDKIKDIKD